MFEDFIILTSKSHIKVFLMSLKNICYNSHMKVSHVKVGITVETLMLVSMTNQNCTFIVDPLNPTSLTRDF